MSNHDELIAQFIEVSGGDEGVAEFYLSSSNWSLEDALSNFLGNQSENDNCGAEQPSGAAQDGNAAAGTASSSFAKSATKPKIATLKNMENQSSNDDEQEAFYAGGSERSGQQVLGPPKRKNFREQLTDMFRMANESSHEEGSPTPSTSTGISWGQGVRLGMTESDHAVVTKPSGSKKEDGQKKPIVVLKLWRQGFSIDDGELRPYDNPENKEFLETVMRGEIPSELLEMGWMVNVDVEDHRQEDFKKQTTARTFRGSGHTLGSPTPNVEETSTTKPPAEQPATNSVEDENAAKEKLKVNTSEPTTTLQIRLADGSRLSAQFNLSHTVADIQQYIQNARPQYAQQNFRLVSSFPTRELVDTGVTIEVAGLKNAALMQRLI